MVARKGIDGHHRGHAVDLDVFDLLAQVCRAGEDIVWILLEQVRRQGSAGHNSVLPRMDFERADGGYDHGGVRRKTRGSALDVEEALGSHVGAKARLRDQEVTAVYADQVGEH